MPLAKNISPYRAVPDVRKFSIEDFVASLDTCGPQLTSSVKGDWECLYRRFFKSPNFVRWYSQRHREMAQKLQLLHLQSLSEAKIEIWMAEKSEVELVDMVLRIRSKLDEADVDLFLPDIIRERLDKHVDTIIKTLPDDLRGVLDKKRSFGKCNSDAAMGAGPSEDAAVATAVVLKETEKDDDKDGNDNA
jgi:hypothetical protein